MEREARPGARSARRLHQCPGDHEAFLHPATAAGGRVVERARGEPVPRRRARRVERPVGLSRFRDGGVRHSRDFQARHPWTKIPVQYSAHREEGAGHRHVHFLAADGTDPRRALAEALVSDCTGAGAVVTYHSSFEKGCLRGLADAVPELAGPLMEIHERVVDLEPMVAHHVYHPDFAGSFSLKIVLPTLCPELSYDRSGNRRRRHGPIRAGPAALWVDPASGKASERQCARHSSRTANGIRGPWWSSTGSSVGWRTVPRRPGEVA